MPRIRGDLDELVTTIQHAARGEAQKKHQAAQRLSDTILNDAQARAKEVRREILNRAQTEAQAQGRRQVAETVQKVKRNYLNTREEILSQVWQQAEQKLRSLPDDSERYTDVLRQLAAVAVNTLGTGHFEVAADPRGHKLLTKRRLEAWGREMSEQLDGAVSFERAADPAHTWGGLVVTQAQSRRQVDATFPTRLQLAQTEIRPQIFAQVVKNDDR